MSLQNLTKIKEIFAHNLLIWQKTHGRHNLPWQVSDPYKIWLSEIMLQQTQVSTVLDYYPRFLATFPTVHDLAHAHIDDVFALWAGLGYYSRAKNLHAAAQQVVQLFDGQFPRERTQLETLKGVGRTTAAAIAAFAYQQRETILDGNVKRVLSRVLALDGLPEDKAFQQSMWQHAEEMLPTSPHDMPSYTQGLMDLGATICKRSKPLCLLCPMSEICLAKAQDLTAVLPRKKQVTKVKAVEYFWLIITFTDGQLYLEKRPKTGIWSQLFCCPSFEGLTTAEQWLQQQQLSLTDFTEEMSFSHQLTHRSLSITPLRYTGLSIEHPLHKQSLCIDAILQMGIPKPFSQYLQKHLTP